MANDCIHNSLLFVLFQNANLEEQESDPHNVEGLKLPRVQKTKPANYTNIELQDPMKLATLAQRKEDDMNRYKRDPTTKPKVNLSLFQNPI